MNSLDAPGHAQRLTPGDRVAFADAGGRADFHEGETFGVVLAVHRRTAHVVDLGELVDGQETVHGCLRVMLEASNYVLMRLGAWSLTRSSFLPKLMAGILY